MRSRKYFIVLSVVLVTIFICCNNQQKVKRTPSTKGSLECSYSLTNDSLSWNVLFLNPFEIDSNKIIKSHNYQKYLLMPNYHFADRDSILTSFQFTALSETVDSIEPDVYHILIHTQKFYKPPGNDSTLIIVGGDTLYVIPDVINPLVYKPIFISNIRISADSISFVNVDSILEYRPNPNDQMIKPIGFDPREIVYYEWNNQIYQDDRN